MKNKILLRKLFAKLFLGNMLLVWCTILLYFNDAYPVIQFSNIGLNDKFIFLFLVGSLVYFSIKTLVCFIKAKFIKGLVALFLLLVYLVLTASSGLGLLLCPDETRVTLIAKIHTGNFIYSGYRTDCGATTDFGLIIRQERKIFPGLLLVKEIYNEYRRYDFTYQELMPGTILVEINAYGETPAFDFILTDRDNVTYKNSEHIKKVKKFIYF